jgi:gamma-butyrobetaine dioxygenase
LKVIWDDNDRHHKSEYDLEWLKARNFTDENRRNYLQKFYRPTKNLWSKNNFANSLQYFNFNKIVEDDFEMYKWLHALTVNGVAIIKDVPQTENEARVIAERVGFIRRTHYGEEFMVKAKADTSNVAYLSANLQMHTDLPYYKYVPGVNLLHVLVQSKSAGGQNLLTDGFYVAELMKSVYPEEYKLLSTVLVNWYDIGEESTEFHSIYRAPMFCLDYENQLSRINHSIPQRDSFFSVPLSVVKDWYKALAKFIELCHREAAEIKTEEGNLI